MSQSEKRSSVDLSHHLSDFARTLPPIRPPPGSNAGEGMIGMDGGVPDTEYFPIESITVEYLKPSAFPLRPTDVVPHGPGVLGWIANVLTGKGSKTTEASTGQFVIPRRLQPNDPSQFELKSALQYSPVTGLPGAEKTIHNWVARVHKPVYNDWTTLIDVGSSSGWMTCITILLNPGDSFLCDRYAYSGALTLARMRGMFPVAVANDTDGLSAVDLEAVACQLGLESPPRVIYTQGGIQNPSGLLISAQRKKDIYDVAVRYDLIIVEDDPYYFQQASLPYGSSAAPKKQTDEEWLDGLVPSFVRFDYQGRVIRLDTFSKSIGPGGRLGYFTGSPVFLEKLAAFNQKFIGFPSGVCQAVFGELLHRYETEGFTRWLRGITAQYELRRNWTIDALYKALDVRSTDNWSPSLTAFARPDGQMSEKFTKTASLMSFVPPDGGMFIWFDIHLHNHPRYKTLARQTGAAAAKNQLSTELWTAVYDAGVVMRRGELFAVEDDEERAKAGEEDVFMRASFSSGPKESLEKGMQIFATTLVRFFQ
ncbi:Aminotran-1-2 domain-containing protein [Mycena sanguinolenta]|uniref:Aminotran-1-2 domain-containing protein n=1 Tax=Mycena sanguinolenta TaxID=230812 RepID=A0A8H6Z129_9AGAR|nr:Aminotran-1-2 domain-containing protein [Mycena sanguinolenta]